MFGSGDDEEGQDTTSEVSTAEKTLFQDVQSEDESASDEATAKESSTNKEKVRKCWRVRLSKHDRVYTLCLCVQEPLKLSGPRLFGDSDEEEDGGRFDIRPQFEGRAGQKVRRL